MQWRHNGESVKITILCFHDRMISCYYDPTLNETGNNIMSFTIECSRCNESHKAKNEHDSEIWFTQHICKNMRKLGDMPQDILLDLITGTIDETEAWRRVDAAA